VRYRLLENAKESTQTTPRKYSVLNQAFLVEWRSFKCKIVKANPLTSEQVSTKLEKNKRQARKCINKNS